MMVEFATMDHEAGWTQQFHYGTSWQQLHMFLSRLGADAVSTRSATSRWATVMGFFDMLDTHRLLTAAAKTIIYDTQSRDSELVATMIGNFRTALRRREDSVRLGLVFLVKRRRHGETMNALSALFNQAALSVCDRLAFVPFVPTF